MIIIGNNSLKMPVSSDRNFIEKYYFTVLFDRNSGGVNIVWSELRQYVVLFYSNSENVLCDKNS